MAGTGLEVRVNAWSHLSVGERGAYRVFKRLFLHGKVTSAVGCPGLNGCGDMRWLLEYISLIFMDIFCNFQMDICMARCVFDQ